MCSVVSLYIPYEYILNFGGSDGGSVGVVALLLLCCFVAVAVVVAVLTLTRIIKSVVTGQAPVTLEWKNIPGKE